MDVAISRLVLYPFGFRLVSTHALYTTLQGQLAQNVGAGDADDVLHFMQSEWSEWI